MNIWYKVYNNITKYDRSFLVPKVNIYFNIITSKLRTSPKDSVVLHIFNNYLAYFFETILSDAKFSGNEINLEFNDKYSLYYSI